MERRMMMPFFQEVSKAPLSSGFVEELTIAAFISWR